MVCDYINYVDYLKFAPNSKKWNNVFQIVYINTGHKLQSIYHLNVSIQVPVEPLLCWEGAEGQDPVTQAMYKMLYVHTLRPDKVFGACSR